VAQRHAGREVAQRERDLAIVGAEHDQRGVPVERDRTDFGKPVRFIWKSLT
jgi:hypothetical protein